MTDYDTETLFLIPGETPRQKHENIIDILRIIQEIGYPRRGTKEETKTLQDFADEIIKIGTIKDVLQKAEILDALKDAKSEIEWAAGCTFDSPIASKLKAAASKMVKAIENAEKK